MPRPSATLADSQREFYQQRWREFGDDPRSLAYRDLATQNERFFRLARLFERHPGAFTVHEVGCGLGHFGEYLAPRFRQAAYSGTDLCPEFVAACRTRFPQADFHLGDFRDHDECAQYDFLALSGTFNPRLDTPSAEWQAFIDALIRKMFACCRCGVAVNFLSPYCDADRREDELHYQDPWTLTEWIVRDLSRHFEFDWGGPLFEYTLRVYRPEYVRRQYPEGEFDRYFRDVPSPD
jgi:SAM-dependent methyltransferase